MHTTELGVVVVALAVVLTTALVRRSVGVRRRTAESPEAQCRREIRALRQASGRYVRPRRAVVWAAGAPSKPSKQTVTSKAPGAVGCGGCGAGCGGGCGGCGGCGG